MKIAIELNGVIRDFLPNFNKYYNKDKDSDFELKEEEIETNNPFEIFPFESYEEYHRFIYEDYPFEIYGKCDVIENANISLNNWHTNTIHNIDTEEEIEVMLFSTMEYGISIQSTLFFLSKIGCRIREIYLPIDSSKVWDKCDVLIASSPKLLDEKPDNKIAIKINHNYNKNVNSDYAFDNISDFLNDENNTLKLIKK